MSSVALSVTATIASLILVYLLVSNPKGVTSLIQSSGSFVTSESKILQGR